MTPVPKDQQAATTKTAILDAARRRFAAHGYDGTTIRAVAADAAIDASMVMRYFGSKDGLFAAAVTVDLGLPEVTRASRDQWGTLLAQHFIDTWEGETGLALRVLLSSALAGSTSAERMADVFRTQLQPVVAATGPATADEASERAGLIASQILGLALCRYVLKLQPVTAMSRDDVVAWLAPTIQFYLDGARP